MSMGNMAQNQDIAQRLREVAQFLEDQGALFEFLLRPHKCKVQLGNLDLLYLVTPVFDALAYSCASAWP